jgi:hypothetical protein
VCTRGFLEMFLVLQRKGKSKGSLEFMRGVSVVSRVKSERKHVSLVCALQFIVFGDNVWRPRVA